MKESREKEHHHGIRNIFRKESPTLSESNSSSGSHHALSKLFHHHNDSKSDNEGSDSSSPRHHGLSRTGSGFMKRSNTLGKNTPNSSRVSLHKEKEHVVLTKAQTFAHIQSINNKNAAKNHNNQVRAPPSSHEKIKYDPFGLNKTPSQELPRETSFYLSGSNDGERILANPVADPNDYLPEEMKQEHVNLLEDFEIDISNKRLGSGGSSDVRIINALNNKRKCYALKKFTLVGHETDEQFYKRATKEFVFSKISSKSRHVVDIIALVRIQSQSNLSRGWGFVLEFCDGGDLFNSIIKPGWKRAPINERYCIFKQIAYGVKFLHDNDIVHRDLKPENVLIDSRGVAKLCDFGVSEYGHEVPGDLSSPIRLSSAYVGSPPYSSPEVMKLKEASHSELKKLAYDPFKMDHWSLGMLLFCIVYAGVPFQSANPTDHAYRDYKFNHERFCSSNPLFKQNTDYTKGPGSDFKWAAKFGSTGAARVAWKLCHPSPANRYDLDMLFKDPWFLSLEMCLYEDEDQEVSPFIHPDTGLNSTSSSKSNSKAPSRKNTVSLKHDESGSLHTPVRSMLDLHENNEEDKGTKKDRDNDDNESVHSNSSLSYTPLKLQKDDNVAKVDRENTSSSTASSFTKNDEIFKVKSMLDFNENKVLPSLKENEIQKCEEKDNCISKTPSACSSSVSLSSNPPITEKAQSSPSNLPQDSKPDINGSDRTKNKKDISELEHNVLRSNSQVHLDAAGMCDLGYKIKKHHHLEVSTVAVSGSLSRKR